MICMSDADYLQILTKLVAEVANKESKLDYIESSELTDPWVAKHREDIVKQKESISAIISHLSENLVNKKCPKYVYSPNYNGYEMTGIYVGDFVYDFGGERYPKEFIEMFFNDVKFFEEEWVLDLIKQLHP